MGLAQQIGPALGCPSALNPICQGEMAGQNVFNLYPQANVGSDLANSNTFLSAPVIRNSENYYTAKVDQHFSATDTVSAHYSLVDENLFSPFDPVNAFTALPGYGSFTLNHGQNAGVEWTRVFRSKLLNEFRLGFIRMRATVLQQNHGDGYCGAAGISRRPDQPGGPGISQHQPVGFDGIGEPVNYPQDRHDTTLQLSDNVAWTVGRNQFKIGVDIRHLRIDNYLDFLARGDWFFLGDTLAGILGATGASHPCNATPPFDPTTCSLTHCCWALPDYALAVSGNTYNSLRSHGVSTYIQDDIHVVPRLLLNVGLRYEYNSPPVEALNRFQRS